MCVISLFNGKDVRAIALDESLKGAVGLRNIDVHACQQLDYGIVFSICIKHLDDFRAFARQIMTVLESLT